MGFTIRDFFSGVRKTIKTTSTGTDPDELHVPHHNVEHATIAPPGETCYGVALTTDVFKHQLIAAYPPSPDLTQRTYLCAIQVANKGGTAALVSIYDGAATSPDVAIGYVYVPANNTVAVNFPIPLRSSVSTAIYFAADAVSTIYVSGQGYYAQ